MSIGHGIDNRLLMQQVAAPPTSKDVAARGQDPEKIKELAQEFESIFIQQLYKEMRKTVGDGGLIPRTNAEQMMTDMQDLETARETARQGGIGLAEMLVKQLQQID